MNRTNDLQQLRMDVLTCLRSTRADAALGAGSVDDYFHKALGLKFIPEMDISNFSNRLDHLSSQLLALSQEAKNVAGEQALLNSLRYRLMKDRFANISDSASKTFDWIFDTSGSEQQGGSRFMDWLSNGSGIFWIEGKAGSGKSTIMKYICDHHKTKERLLQWSHGRQLISSSFFFWGSGTTLQKSQEGLLRSLLYEILRQCPNMIHIVCSRYSIASQEWASDPWTLSELMEISNKLRIQQNLAVNFTFFIDGLDEYEGEYSQLIGVIQELAEHPNMKICASSRPYYAFKDAFGQFPKHHLILENFTETDIRAYVLLHFGKNPRFETLRDVDARYSDFIQEVTDKAQGVFLWVVLVVRSLLKGFTNADDIPDLQRRLRGLPQTLEGFFRQMFDRIELVYQEQTARIFLIALVTPELSLMALSYLDDEKLSDVHGMKICPMTIEQVSERYETMRRRLAGRCDGLLEVPYRPEDWSSCFFAPVVFMHKSVRDFLLLKDMQAMLSERAGPFNARETLCKAILAQMKSLPSSSIIGGSETPLEDMFRNMAHSALELEIENKHPPTVILNEAEKVFREHPISWKWRRKKTAFLGLAIEFGLQLYTEVRLDVETQMIHAGPRPLLSFALESIYDSSSTKLSMVDMLLSRGASPEQKFGKFSVWQRFVAANIVFHDVPNVKHSDTELLQISRMLIYHGANVDEIIPVGFRTVKQTGRAADLYKPREVPWSKTATRLLVEKFGQDEVERMPQKITPTTKPLLANFLNWFR